MTFGITTFGCDAGRSGIGRYAGQLIRELPLLPDNPDRYEVLVHRGERDAFIPPDTRALVHMLPGHLTHPVPDIAWHQTALPAWCAWRHYDALFLPAGNRRLPMWTPCPTVGTVHDFAAIHVAGKYDPARVFYIRNVLPAMMRRLSHVLTVSESSRADIVEYGRVPPERVTVTPLAVDTSMFYRRDKAQTTELLSRELGLNFPFVLFVSRLEHPGKNHVGLIRAFTLLKNRRKDLPHQLVLAGPEWSGSDQIYREAAASTCSRDILIVGAMRKELLPSLYSAADLFVFPSLYEGFGLPILEAMASGVPVACSNVSSMPEVAGNAAELFDPGDPDGMAAAMERILSDGSGRANRVLGGLARAREFSWQRTARMTRDALHQVASGRD
jgi:glycosyltransferase involved in cell wall biosynthesis